jgi:hypothetical protein
MKKAKVILCFLLAAPLFFLAAQDDFGFGFDDDTGGGVLPQSFPISVRIGGEASAEATGYFNDFDSFDKFKKSNPGNFFFGTINFGASGTNADAVINLDFSANINSLVTIDEAYLRAFFGPFTLEGGYRKLTWGKADSFGPLDVVNPLDYSDLSRITDILGIKTARSMIHGIFAIGTMSRIEAVFIPTFEGYNMQLDEDNRWYPDQIRNLPDVMKSAVNRRLVDQYSGSLTPSVLSAIQYKLANSPAPQVDPENYIPDTAAIEYAQAGLRFTTTLGPVDLGLQYYFGCLPRPSISFENVDAFLRDLLFIQSSDPSYEGNQDLLLPSVAYNRFHQAGVDYAQVAAGFNIRAELAANITMDTKGENGLIRNPFLGWSVGFDRDIPVVGVNVNFQCNETIRLFNDKVHVTGIDTEADTEITGTRLTLILSKKLLRDNVEIKCTGIFDVENKDMYIIPALSWTIQDLKAVLAAGFFTGKDGGEFSQYRDNGYIKASLTYSF